MPTDTPSAGGRAAIAAPPVTTNPKGEIRRVGIEIEFADLPLARAAAIIADTFGGTPTPSARFLVRVPGTRFGEFKVELDTQYAQPGDDPAAPGAQIRDKLAEVVGEVSKAVVPSEITCPPVAYTDIGAIADLMDALAGAGATGTDASLFYAFGLQLNPEVSSLDVEKLLPVMRAYMVLADALRAEIQVDALRSILPFANAFPLRYRRRVAKAGYSPAMGRLIDDYLEHNPTRNRELDLLPLFAHIDEKRVRAKVDDPLIKPRPTYHYRLPNARFTRAGEHLIREWNRWVAVERLAADGEKLARLAREFHAKSRWFFDARAWAARTREYLVP